MGNQCICLSNDGKKPQSKLIQDFSRKVSTTKSSINLNEQPREETPLPSEIEKKQESVPTHSESFYTAYSPPKTSKKRGNSFPGSETEYMSYDMNRMSILKSDVQKLSQRISALSQTSKMPSSEPSDDNKRFRSRKRSSSQDSACETQPDIKKDLHEPVKALESYRSDSDPATNDTVGYSHMNLKDIIATNGTKVGFPLEQVVKDIIKREEREDSNRKSLDKFAERASVGGIQEAWANPIRNGEGKKNSVRAKSYIEHDFLALKQNMTPENKTERKSSFEILERESLKPLKLVKRASSTSKKLVRKSRQSGFRLSLTEQAKTDTQFTDYDVNSADFAKNIFVETLSPRLVPNKNSFTEENKDNIYKEGRLSARRSEIETREDSHYPDLSKEDLEFVRKGQDTLTLVLQILRSDDYLKLEKLYEDKKEGHNLKIYYNSFQKSNGQTTIKVFWMWQAPCNSEEYIRFSSNSEELLKIDEQLDKLKEIELIYATESESFAINYQSYKKAQICMPRDIVYLRHVRKLGEGEWADASVSVKHEDFPEFKDHLRCEIICGGSVAKDTDSDSCVIKSYTETDFKTNIPSFMAKSFIKTYVKGLVEPTYASLKINTPSM